MRIIDRYIGREVFSYALLGLAVFTFVFFVPQLVRFMELAVRPSAGAGALALLFVCTLPPVLTFTLPMGVLVGVLIGLSRMSADSEIVALHALGIGIRRMLLPIGAVAVGGALLTALTTFWLAPASLRAFRQLEERLRAAQASLHVQPRVFDERFPDRILYVQDVEAAGTRWRGLLLAETGPRDSTRLTLAEEAVITAHPHLPHKVQFHLRNGGTHEFSRAEPDRYALSSFLESDLAITLSPRTASASRDGPRRVGELSLAALLRAPREQHLEARVELHRRLAFPAACLLFAMLGIPVGVRPHRGGRAFGFIFALLLVCAYYLLFVAGAGMARRGAVPAALGVWGANLLTLLGGLWLLPRMEEIGAESPLERLRHTLAGWFRRPAPPHRLPSAPPSATAHALSSSGIRRTGGLPLLIDLYLLRHFFAYLLVMLAAFLLLFHAFTYFELLNDITRQAIPGRVVASYFLHLTPHLLYQLLPLAALVAVLTTLGILAKHNELVAFCASGISLYRLALPLLLAGAALGGALFLLDDAYLPYANQRQDALRNQIKGRPAQTFHQPRRQWIFGDQMRLYNYDLFDPDRNLFGGLHLYVLDPATFQLTRRVYATRAHWEPALLAWVLEEGWVREFNGSTVTRYQPFRVLALDEMAEPPSWFKREVRQSYQMNWRELRHYIGELQQAGFDTARLSVQWHKKFAYPLMAPLVVLLAVPFALLVGTRGAVGGLALGVGIAIVYWAVSALLEALGAVGQLPPLAAGWAPDAIFALLGLHFLLKVQT